LQQYRAGNSHTYKHICHPRNCTYAEIKSGLIGRGQFPTASGVVRSANPDRLGRPRPRSGQLFRRQYENGRN